MLFARRVAALSSAVTLGGALTLLAASRPCANAAPGSPSSSSSSTWSSNGNVELAPTGVEVLQRHIPAERLRQLRVDWRLDRIARFGLPYPVAGHLTIHPGWIGAYDCTRKNPLWAAQLVSATQFAQLRALRSADTGAADSKKQRAVPSRDHSRFYPDPTLPPHLRATPSDYSNSGYDRGHLIPAADLKHLSQQALDETFDMANVSPQVGNGFNRHYWARLEEMVRQIVRDASDRGHGSAEAIVCTGPLYLPQRRELDGRLFVEYECIGEGGRVAVPTHFFKVILTEAIDTPASSSSSSSALPLHIAAFILPNKPIDPGANLAEFEFPLDAVESAAGLKFFPHLPADRPLLPLCANGRCRLPPDFSAASAASGNGGGRRSKM